MRGVAQPYEEVHKMINGIEYKKCTICNKWFPMNKEFFYKNKSSKQDGFNPYCKECTKKKNYKWQIENPEKYKKSKKKYDSKPERKPIKKEISRRFRDKGGLKLYQQKHRDKINGYSKNKRENRTHKISDKEWEICKKYFNYQCAYCGLHIEEHWIKFKGKLVLGDFHRDHVDDNGANDISNCVSSCKGCNTSKWKFSLDEWYNEDNEIFSKERLIKIHNWLNEDYKIIN